MGKQVKTNAMRILDRLGIPYEHLEYACKDFTDGSAAADQLGLDHRLVFKTLTAAGSDGGHYVFVLPVDESLDLKKCAAAVGVKSVQLVHQKDLLPLTGYMRGGCTAIGMKKPFPVRIHRSAADFDRICVSGGRIGSQLLLAPEDLRAAADAEYADLIQS